MRSIDVLASKEYDYLYEDDRLIRATENDITLSGEIVTAKTVIHTICYYYNSEGQMTRKRIAPANGTAQVIYYETSEDNTAVKFYAGGQYVTSHSKSDEFGRKVFDELQLGTGFVSRQFSYHTGEATEEHIENRKLKSSPTTQLVSSIALSDGRTLSYEYDEEERITKVTETFQGENVSVTEYTYDSLGQLLTETVNGVVVNTMSYDNYGNIVSKNGVAYTYGDNNWKDLLTGYGDKTITYDAQGNPVNYLGHTLTWEKGRQLKKFVKTDGTVIDYTYNANGIRTSKTIKGSETEAGVTHIYTLDGTKILRETWTKDGVNHSIIPMYDNEDSVCGIQYNGEPFYFQKNLQGDIIAIVDKDANTVARYSYDAWGVCTIEEDSSECNIAEVNPYRYRGYYFDVEIEMYYLQSRYYNPIVGRFMNEDEAIFLILDTNLLGLNIYSYCKNNPIINVDIWGFWAEKYSGFTWTKTGFNINVQIAFLSRSFCVSYANDIIRQKGQWYWWGKGYKGMNATRIAQELWFHALAYYVGSPIKKILNKLGVSWDWLNKKIEKARYMQINNNDDRAWIFALAWSYASAIKNLVRQHLGGGYVYSHIYV
ncbi:MAG: RHS repeat-associated core domain-containing protein [Agathobacter sp.]|nr:RHS repeat-associated core domain-containing protein [Agathobacter sp.]